MVSSGQQGRFQESIRFAAQREYLLVHRLRLLPLGPFRLTVREPNSSLGSVRRGGQFTGAASPNILL
jgi:hypothetical protein